MAQEPEWTSDDVLWRAHAGPQADAILADEDEIFYGGAKGGGKSEVIVMRPLAQVHRPAFRALILRESYDELEELLSRARSVYPLVPGGAVWNGGKMEWTFASGAFVKFGYCKTPSHVERYQGREWSQINFDEAANVAQIRRIWPDLMKEVRSPDPRIQCSGFASGNPGYAGHAFWKQQFVDRCGKEGGTYIDEVELPNGRTIRKRRRYIPARIEHNPVYANDDRYLATLWRLPEERRLQLLAGLWDGGGGLALPQLDRNVHFVRPFEPPPHWVWIGGFDWGYAHRWVFTWAAVTEDGDLIVIDTIRGRGDLPDEIAREIRRRCPSVRRIQYIAAGHDTWHERKARGENTPTVAEWLVNRAALPLVKANQDRVHGLNNLRDYTSWRARGPFGEDTEPGIRWMRTDGNEWLFDQLETIVTDPDNPEKALKVDVDPDTGEGGDDGYDATRYMVASRPQRAPALAFDMPVKPWSKAALEYEAREGRRVRSTPPPADDLYEPLVMSDGVNLD